MNGVKFHSEFDRWSGEGSGNEIWRATDDALASRRAELQYSSEDSMVETVERMAALERVNDEILRRERAKKEPENQVRELWTGSRARGHDVYRVSIKRVWNSDELVVEQQRTDVHGRDGWIKLDDESQLYREGLTLAVLSLHGTPK